MSQGRNVSPFERGLSLVAGAAAVGFGLSRRSTPSLLAAVAGGYLLYRGVSGNCPVYRAVGVIDNQVGQVVDFSTQVTIQKQVAQVFAFLRQPQRFPEFSRRISDVEVVDSERWLVSARLPFGRSVRFQLRLTTEEEDRQLAWCTEPESEFRCAISVRLKRTGEDGTEVRVDGWLEAPRIQARILKRAEHSRAMTRVGLTPSKALEHELMRLRQLLEAGEVATVRGQSAGAHRAGRVSRRRERLESEVTRRMVPSGAEL